MTPPSGAAATGCGGSAIVTIGSGAGRLATLRDGGVGAGGFGVAAGRDCTPLARLESCSASALISRGTILKMASALIAVAMGAAAGTVSGVLARLLNSSTPTVVTSAAGTS